jgi:hypothetical protein
MFGSGSAAASSRLTALREAGANGSGGSRPGQHIPHTNTPGCPYQKGQTHNGYLSEGGGDNWAIATTLIRTAILNGVNPQAWLTDVLERMVRGEVSSKALHTLLPWTWREAQHTAAA